MSTDAPTLTCPNCGSHHLVEEYADRLLCLYCHSLSTIANLGTASQRLVVEQRLCAHCGAENPRQADTCHACERELRPRCLKCGAEMAVWHADCPRCATNQAAYREQLAAQERERQRQQAERTTRQRRPPPPRRYRRHPWRGFWRLGWMVWPLMWLVSTVGRSVRDGVERFVGQGPDPGLTSQLSSQTVSLTIGACIFGVGVVVFLASAIPSRFHPD